jgi:hypothetical protein
VAAATDVTVIGVSRAALVRARTEAIGTADAAASASASASTSSRSASSSVDGAGASASTAAGFTGAASSAGCCSG